MKLKGLVWFFAITLILISLYQLSFTWVVNNHEKAMKQKAEKQFIATHPGVKGDEKDDFVRDRLLRLLDSTKDTKIYPIIGTSYQKCKENELNLGLDLQGGMSVTMDVSLEGLIKSLSNNPKNPELLAALAQATNDKVNSNENYINLFQKAFEQKNPGAKLSALFAGSGKKIKSDFSNDQVISEIKDVSTTAINQTYKILLKRIDKFGVAQPNINLDAVKGIITVELAGVHDPERVRKYLQSSANLQFWEVYNFKDLKDGMVAADKAVTDYVSGINANDTTNKSESDSVKRVKNVSALFKVMTPLDVTKENTYDQQYFFTTTDTAL